MLFYDIFCFNSFSAGGEVKFVTYPINPKQIKKANLNLFVQLPFLISLELLSNNLCWSDVSFFFLDESVGLIPEVSAWKNTQKREDYIKFCHVLDNT